MTALIFLVGAALVFFVVWNYLARNAGPKAKIGPDGTNVREPESFVVHHEGKGQGLDIANAALKERTEELSRDLPGDTHKLDVPVPGRDMIRLDQPPSDVSRYGDVKVPPAEEMPSAGRGRIIQLRNWRRNRPDDEAVAFSPDPAWAMEMAEEFDWEALTDDVNLPAHYGEDITMALVRNPQSLYVYWERAGHGDETLIADLGEDLYSRSTPCLHIYDVASGAYPGRTGGRSWTIDVSDLDDHWFINDGLEPGREYIVAFERRTPGGKYCLLSYSRPVRTPDNGPLRPSAEGATENDVALSMLYQLYVKQPGEGHHPGSQWR